MRIESGDVFKWGGLGAVVAAVVIAFVLVIRSLAATGGVDFCWVEYRPPGYLVTAHRPWRADVELTRVASMEEAVRAMAATNCRVGQP